MKWPQFHIVGRVRRSSGTINRDRRPHKQWMIVSSCMDLTFINDDHYRYQQIWSILTIIGYKGFPRKTFSKKINNKYIERDWISISLYLNNLSMRRGSCSIPHIRQGCLWCEYVVNSCAARKSTLPEALDLMIDMDTRMGRTDAILMLARNTDVYHHSTQLAEAGK